MIFTAGENNKTTCFVFFLRASVLICCWIASRHDIQNHGDTPRTAWEGTLINGTYIDTILYFVVYTFILLQCQPTPVPVVQKLSWINKMSWNNHHTPMDVSDMSPGLLKIHLDLE
jgi:homoserine acetyltransferase